MIGVQSKTRRLVPENNEQPQMVQQATNNGSNVGSGGKRRTKAYGSSNKRQKTTTTSTTISNERKIDPSDQVTMSPNIKQQLQVTPVIHHQYQANQGLAEQRGQKQQQEDSVWVIGLMNNIEHLLATFNSINNQSKLAQQRASLASSASTSLASSGNSTPSAVSSPPFVMSAIQASSSSPSSSSSSYLSSMTNSPNGSPASNYTPSSSGQIASSATLLSSATQQQVAPRGALGISRQIKFHEYKGPPQAKKPPANVNKQQQTQIAPQPDKQELVEASNAPLTPISEQKVSSDQVGTISGGQSQSSRPINGTKIATSNQNKQAKRQLIGDNDNNNNNSETPSKRQAYLMSQPMVFARQHGQSVVADENQLLHIATANVKNNNNNNDDLIRRQLQPDHGSQILQTGGNFYVPNDGLQLPNRNTITSSSVQPISLPIGFQQVFNDCQTLNQSQQKWLNTNHNTSTQIFSLNNNDGVSSQSNNINKTVNSANMTAGSNDGTNTAIKQCYNNNLSSYMSGIESDANQWIGYSNSEQQYQMHLQQQQNQNPPPSDFGSFLANVVANDSAGDEDDTCDIEPTICFGGQQFDENLLFSEFIDLQDVPLNVDESDWLKKFLPPCSMGS